MLTDLISAGTNPYLFWGKVAGAVLAVAAMAAVVWYIAHTFSDRNRLLVEQGKLQTQLLTEKQRTAVALEQAKVWHDTVVKMNQAVKTIKVNSDVYIQNVDDAETPIVPDTGTIPFIVPTASDTAGYGFIGYSAGRKPAPPAARRLGK